MKVCVEICPLTTYTFYKPLHLSNTGILFSRCRELQAKRRSPDQQVQKSAQAPSERTAESKASNGENLVER